jgi:hypothetical protein
LGKFAREINKNWVGKISVLAGGGDIRNKDRHGANVIVNAANTYVGFGGGISGAIAEQVGDRTKIEIKAKELINTFNQRIKPPQEDPNSNDQISTICKWSGSFLKNGYHTFAFKNSGEWNKVYISKDHSFLKGKKLDHTDNTPPFSIQFNKKNASRQEGDKTWYFDKDNTNFELNPFGDWPDEQTVIELTYFTLLNGYHTFENLFSGQRQKVIKISENHPRIKKLLSEGKLQDGKRFIIRYGEADKISGKKGDILTFNEFNQELEIIEA